MEHRGEPDANRAATESGRHGYRSASLVFLESARRATCVQAPLEPPALSVLPDALDSVGANPRQPDRRPRPTISVQSSAACPSRLDGALCGR